MIPRYSRPEMVAIWEPDTKFRIWFEIEAHACEALAEIGVIPKEAAKNIRERGDKAVFDVAKIDEIEREVKHDVIAFLTHLAEFIGEEARFVHQGMTSSDVLDTTLNVQLVRAADILLADLDRVLAALKKRAFEHKDTITIGRSHGIHAEPVTFGLKMAEAYAEFARCRERLVAARRGGAAAGPLPAVAGSITTSPTRSRRSCRQSSPLTVTSPAATSWRAAAARRPGSIRARKSSSRMPRTSASTTNTRSLPGSKGQTGYAGGAVPQRANWGGRRSDPPGRWPGRTGPPGQAAPRPGLQLPMPMRR